jgi:predicted nucleic acid-binding protein
MEIVVDTSIIIAVIVNESRKGQLVEMTRGASLHAPSSLHWEVGNAFSAMFKRNRIDLSQALNALTSYKTIPIRFHDVDLKSSLELSDTYGLYAYDAYFLTCAMKVNGPLLTLDSSLADAAHRAGITVLEV